MSCPLFVGRLAGGEVIAFRPDMRLDQPDEIGRARAGRGAKIELRCRRLGMMFAPLSPTAAASMPRIFNEGY